MSLIWNFRTEMSIIEGNPQTLPQIRIDDVEAEGLRQHAQNLLLQLKI
jgi:hypothetical protein